MGGERVSAEARADSFLPPPPQLLFRSTQHLRCPLSGHQSTGVSTESLTSISPSRRVASRSIPSLLSPTFSFPFLLQHLSSTSTPLCPLSFDPPQSPYPSRHSNDRDSHSPSRLTASPTLPRTVGSESGRSTIRTDANRLWTSAKTVQSPRRFQVRVASTRLNADQDAS